MTTAGERATGGARSEKTLLVVSVMIPTMTPMTPASRASAARTVTCAWRSWWLLRLLVDGLVHLLVHRAPPALMRSVAV